MIEFNREQQQLIERAREFAFDEIRPAALQADQDRVIPLQLYEKAWRHGLLHFSIPREQGGAGLDCLTNAAVLEALAQGCSGFASCIMSNDLAHMATVLFGTAGQKKAYLSPFSENFQFASYCLTEPEAGSDNSAMETRLEKQGEQLTLSGRKDFIINTSHSRQFIVICKDGVGMSIVVLRGDLVEKIDRGSAYDTLGFRSCNIGSLSFEGIPVDQEMIIGLRKHGFNCGITASLNYSRIMASAIAIGVAQASLDVSLAFARKRVQFGTSISNHQLVQRLLVEMKSQTHRARLATHQAAWLCDQWLNEVREQGLVRTMESGSKSEKIEASRGIMEIAKQRNIELYSSLAKNAAAEAAKYCSVNGLQIHGKLGCMNDSLISKLYRDAPNLDISDGTNQILTVIAAREMTEG